MLAPAPEIFKAYDIRGIVRSTLTADVVRQIGLALGTEAVARGIDAIVIGRDGRLSGPNWRLRSRPASLTPEPT